LFTRGCVASHRDPSLIASSSRGWSPPSVSISSGLGYSLRQIGAFAYGYNFGEGHQYQRCHWHWSPGFGGAMRGSGEVQGFDRFEGGLYKQVAATVAGDQAL
jgi:hypothetical protein